MCNELCHVDPEPVFEKPSTLSDEIGRTTTVRVHEHSRDSLRKLRICGTQLLRGQSGSEMGVDIDETGSDVQARGVDFGLSGSLRQVADCGDLISGDTNVCITPRIAGTI
jgi:hypothetical protein